jgi:hypothetical protein
LTEKEKTTWTREEMLKIMDEEIRRDRMVSFLTAAIRWGQATGMAPQILEQGQQMLGAIMQPVKPQESVQLPGEIKEE